MLAKIPRLYEPAPHFKAWSKRDADFIFGAKAGRRMVLAFIGSASDPVGKQIHRALLQLSNAGSIGDTFIGVVSNDPADRGRLPESQNLVAFDDSDRRITTLFGLEAEGISHAPFSFVIDQRLRIYSHHFEREADPHIAGLLSSLAMLPLIEEIGENEGWAPVLSVPRVFEPALCRALIEHFEKTGGAPTGVMRDEGGRTVGVFDDAFKKRRDCLITDEILKDSCRRRIYHRLLPEILRSFHFWANHIERDVIACYDAGEFGHFNPHRDNSTPATAHRRFAVSVNLNTGEYEGGALRFPEFSGALYKPEVGGALVFSCALLHEALPVTRGRRFCYLPFLYDDAAAEQRRKSQVDSGAKPPPPEESRTEPEAPAAVEEETGK